VTWVMWNLISFHLETMLVSVLDRCSDEAGVPDLSVRGITSICGGGDSRDPTTNEQVVAP